MSNPLLIFCGLGTLISTGIILALNAEESRTRPQQRPSSPGLRPVHRSGWWSGPNLQSPYLQTLPPEYWVCTAVGFSYPEDVDEVPSHMWADGHRVEVGTDQGAKDLIRVQGEALGRGLYNSIPLEEGGTELMYVDRWRALGYTRREAIDRVRDGIRDYLTLYDEQLDIEYGFGVH